MLVVLEGIVMCFVLLLVCVVGIANGPVGLVTFYEPEVQERVIELGLTTKERIKRNTMLAGIGLFVPALFLVPYMVYGVNGAQGFREGFTQMLIISLIYGLFDRLFIDWWWVGHTRTWIIPGTRGPHALHLRKDAGSQMGWYPCRVPTHVRSHRLGHDAYRVMPARTQKSEC